MPRKKAVDPEQLDTAQDDIRSDTEMEDNMFDRNENTEASDPADNMDNLETEMREDENESSEPGDDVIADENTPISDTGIDIFPEEGAKQAEAPEGEAEMPIPETDSDDTGHSSGTDVQDPDIGAQPSEEGLKTENPDTDMEKPKKKRGRPRKKPTESESQEPVMKTRISTPVRAAGNQVLTIGDELSVELDTDKSRNDLLDLAESMNGFRILSGVIQGIERSDSGMSFAVIYWGSFKIVIPTEEIISLPRDIGDRDPQAVMHAQLNRRLGAEIDFVIKGIDQKSGLAAASRTDAMQRKKRRYFYGTGRDGKDRIYEGLCAEARVMSTIRNGIFVEFFGVETYIPLMELSYQRWHDATEHFQNGI